MTGINWVALIVLILLFALVTVMCLVLFTASLWSAVVLFVRSPRGVRQATAVGLAPAGAEDWHRDRTARRGAWNGGAPAVNS